MWVLKQEAKLLARTDICFANVLVKRQNSYLRARPCPTPNALVLGAGSAA